METTDNPSGTLRQRGRRSAASRLALVSDIRLRRPPPKGLTDSEKAVWTELVEAVRPDWFHGGSVFLLELYCRLICQERRLAECIAQEEVGSTRWMESV